jgi:hypothetical protein
VTTDVCQPPFAGLTRRKTGARHGATPGLEAMQNIAAPYYALLAKAVPPEECGGFDFKGCTAEQIAIFQQGASGRYLFISTLDDGALHAFRYNAHQHSYDDMPLAAALEYVYADIERIGASKTMPFKDAFALRRARGGHTTTRRNDAA